MKLVFATHNPNKVKEIQSLVPKDIQLLSLKDIGCNEPIEENASTIEGNAKLKTSYVYEKYGYDVFADDTGLEVQALNNAPGVYSARYAGEDKNSQDNINLLLKNLEGIKQRQAQFKTVISVCIKGKFYSFEGIIKGEITQKSMGENGFGYDPIFLPDRYNQTFGQLSSEEKNQISHRAIATKKLVSFLQQLS